MNKSSKDLITRILPNLADRFEVNVLPQWEKDSYRVYFKNDKVSIDGNCDISIAVGFYEYLKQICKINWSWNGNRDIQLKNLVSFEGEIKDTIKQEFRVYMNYCTIAYSMCFWDWERWQKELDFMAMNGINMPLTVIGSEAVWYETLLEFGYTKTEALETISGIAFWPWQLMTNIDSYMPPTSEQYVYDRLELGKKIMARTIELGMQPIQQGFAGHVPMSMRTKFPKAKIKVKSKWCLFPNTAQLDPLDPLFKKFGLTYLQKQKELLGSHHYFACDPFHEGAPPKPWSWYLRSVGKTIDKVYKEFDDKSIWVMQSWSIRKAIATAVPKDRLLILDINSQQCKVHKNFWGYKFVAGQLHNFGGKNALEGKLSLYSKNYFKELKDNGVNVVGTGLFMEGIEQNPIVYDLLFDIGTKNRPFDIKLWLNDYIVRRYGAFYPQLEQAFSILLNTCYKDNGVSDNEVGSMIAARPMMIPKKASPCDTVGSFYNHKELQEALKLMLSVQDELGKSDGYQFDITDITRQVLSNLFYDNQHKFAKAYASKDIKLAEGISLKQLDLLLDIDNLLSHRSETTLAKWVCDSHNLANNQEQKLYFDRNARTLVTLWGDVDGDTALFDYAWKEWSGLISEYYYPRWENFYKLSLNALKENKTLVTELGLPFFGRTKLKSTQYGKNLAVFENNWCKTYKDYPYPQDKNVLPVANELIKKWIDQ